MMSVPPSDTDRLRWLLELWSHVCAESPEQVLAIIDHALARGHKPSEVASMSELSPRLPRRAESRRRHYGRPD
jgi:hypothetical protein